MGRMRRIPRSIVILAVGLCLPLAASGAARKKPRHKAPVKPAAAGRAASGGSITGMVRIGGKIRKVKKAFNPYADVYGGASEKKEAPPAHLCVYLEEVPGTWAPPAAHAVLDQRDREFTVDLLPVLPGTSVDFTNHDTIFHNIFSFSKPNDFDLGRRGGGETVTRVFDKLPAKGIGVVSANCEIHSNMKATILIMRNPFWTVVPEAGGGFRLDGIPPGTYRLTGWHVSLTPKPEAVTVRAGASVSATLIMSGED